MQVIREASALEPLFGCAVVPTMGALHEGHASLIRSAAASGRPAVVTVFVNPTQFGPRDDFARYPRTMETDCAIAEAAGAAAVYCPAVEEIYPSGIDPAQREAAGWPVPPAAVEPGLEDLHRPGHFGGVCQVVSRLFDLTRPSLAFFGEKDFQQLRVIEQMVAVSKRWGPLRVVGCPTVREQDGLAMSSRNRYLDESARRQASAISHVLQSAHDTLATHRSAPISELASTESAMRQALHSVGLSVDYAAVRDAKTLLTPTDESEMWRGLVAARLGATRLIDNLALWKTAPRD